MGTNFEDQKPERVVLVAAQAFVLRARRPAASGSRLRAMTDRLVFAAVDTARLSLTTNQANLGVASKSRSMVPVTQALKVFTTQPRVQGARTTLCKITASPAKRSVPWWEVFSVASASAAALVDSSSGALREAVTRLKPRLDTVNSQWCSIS